MTVKQARFYVASPGREAKITPVIADRPEQRSGFFACNGRNIPLIAANGERCSGALTLGRETVSLHADSPQRCSPIVTDSQGIAPLHAVGAEVFLWGLSPQACDDPRSEQEISYQRWSQQ